MKYAVLEDNGKVSILKKEAYQLVTKKDFGLLLHPQDFPVEVIIDGILVEKNLMSHELLENELKRKGKKISDVFYAARGMRHQLVFDLHEDGIHHPLDKE